jgi:DNA-binding LacI/PurR family transcriptional regulator
VADLAGVSMGTASQALNYRPSVAPETRARVIDAARTLGYPVKPPPEASTPSELEVIGMLTKHDVGRPPEVNPFYAYVQAGVEQACRAHKTSLMYANIEVDASNHPVVWPTMITEQRIDGLLLVGTFIEDTVDLFKRQTDVPIVLVDSYAPGLPYDSVVIDNVPGARTGVQYLIDRGHRHIGLIGSNDSSPPSILERRTAYMQTLRANDIPDTYIEPSSSVTKESGYAAAKRLLTRAPQITAIFACNDLTALGAMNAARDMGIEIPERLSIVGFDNIDLAREVAPALTTIHVYKTWLGSLGVRQLLARAQYPEQPKLSISLSTTLVERESVRTLQT